MSKDFPYSFIGIRLETQWLLKNLLPVRNEGLIIRRTVNRCNWRVKSREKSDWKNNEIKRELRGDKKTKKNSKGNN